MGLFRPLPHQHALLDPLIDETMGCGDDEPVAFEAKRARLGRADIGRRPGKFGKVRHGRAGAVEFVRAAPGVFTSFERGQAAGAKALILLRRLRHDSSRALTRYGCEGGFGGGSGFCNRTRDLNSCPFKGAGAEARFLLGLLRHE